jgi:hypothetical protein
MNTQTLVLSKTTIYNLINLAFFQAIWFATVIGAADDVLWYGLLGLLGFLTIHPFISLTAKTDFQLAGIAVLLGLITETVIVRTHILEYSYNMPFPRLAPAWILILWANMALTINGCLGWLHERYALAAILGAVGGAGSYFGGIKLGAATTDLPIFISLGLIALVYACVIPALLYIARLLNAATET